MRFVTVGLLLVFVGLLATSSAYPGRGCIYVNGECYEQCPVGTHAYTTGCGYLTPEATCAAPDPVPDKRGQICDYSACYCDAPTVRDGKTGLCVEKDQCT